MWATYPTAFLYKQGVYFLATSVLKCHCDQDLDVTGIIQATIIIYLFIIIIIVFSLRDKICHLHKLGKEM